jgi:ribosomal-protein-alanine N-acetyltransferase
VLGLLRKAPAGYRLDGRAVFLRLPSRNDYEEWSALRENSRAFLSPWEPGWSAGELSLRSFKARLANWRGEIQAGTAWPFFLFERASGRLAGGISLFNIRHGAAESGEIGYWTGEPFAGQGYMSEAIGLIIPFGLEVLGLRRIVAACIPENARSARVLEKAGFEREGVVRSYLQINGVRRDHVLYSLVAPDGGMPLRGD